MALVQDLTMSDDELVSRVRDGDDVAFERLYGRYGGRIGGYVAGMVGDAGRAEDVTQEVFVAALRRIRATDGAIRFKPWVYEIARNAAIDDFRRAKRRPEVSVAHESEGERPGLEALASSEPAPDAAVETREALGTLTTALGGLSDVHRRVLVLRELEGRSYDEIAAATELTVPAVESALFRARKRLGAEYEELASGQRCHEVQALVVGRSRRLRARERGSVRRHLSHCRPCRRHAARCGFDFDSVGLLAGPRRGVAKAAGMLPLPGIPAWLTQLGAGAGDAPVAWGKAVATTAVVLAAGGTGVVASYDRTEPAMAPAPRRERVAARPDATDRTRPARAAAADRVRARPSSPAARPVRVPSAVGRTAASTARGSGTGRTPASGATRPAPERETTLPPDPGPEPSAPAPVTPAPAASAPDASTPAASAPAASGSGASESGTRSPVAAPVAPAAQPAVTAPVSPDASALLPAGAAPHSAPSSVPDVVPATAARAADVVTGALVSATG